MLKEKAKSLVIIALVVALTTGIALAYNGAANIVVEGNLLYNAVSDGFGGLIHNVQESFDEGIAVDGTEVINGTGSYVGAVSGTTGAFSSTLGVTGAATFSSSVSVTGTLAGKMLTETVAGTLTSSTSVLTTADSGTTFLISGTGTAFTLPTTANSAGVWYRFVVAGDIDTASSTITSAGGSSGDDIEGSLIVAGVVADCNAADVITIGNNFDNIGDFVDIMSNGSDWFVLSSNALTAAELACSG